MAGILNRVALPTQMVNKKMSGASRQTKIRGEVKRVGGRVSSDRKSSHNSGHKRSR